MKHTTITWQNTLALSAIVLLALIAAGTAFMQRPPLVNNFPRYLVDDGDRGYIQTGRWSVLKGEDLGGFAFDQRYVLGRETSWIPTDPGNAFARWTFQVQKPGAHDVLVTWKTLPESERDNLASFAPFRISHMGGVDTVEVDQSVDPSGEMFGGPVIGPDGSRVRQERPFELIGTYTFGKTAVVELANTGIEGGIIADAVFIRPAKIADLMMTQSVGATSTKITNPDYKPGSSMQYIYSATNLGTSVATKVTVTAALPVAFIPSTKIDKRCKISAGTLTCIFPSIAVKKSASIKVPGTISKTAVCDTELKATSDVIGTEKDPNMNNNKAQVTVRLCKTGSGGGDSGGGGGDENIPFDPNGADVSVTVKADKQFAAANDEVDYTATIRNKGGKDAKDVGVNISVNPFWETLSYITDPRCTTNNGQAYCRFDLAKGASTVITYSTRTNSIFTCVATSSTAVDVRSPLRDPYEQDNRAGLSVPKNCPELPYVLMTMTSDPTPQAAPGTEVTFKTVVYNQGFNSEIGRAGDAKNIRFRMKFPCFAFRGGSCITGGWERVSPVESDSRCTVDGTSKDLTCTVPTLKWGEKAEFFQKVRVDKAGCANDIVTSYEVLGKDGNVTIQPPTNSWSIAVNCSALRGDMEVVSLTPTNTVAQNGVINYQLQLRNKGQRTSDIWVNSSLPAGTTFIEGSPQGCLQSAVGSQTFGCYLGSVNPGDLKTIRFSLRTNAACNTLHQSTASIRFGDVNEDQDLSNNMAVTSTTVTCN